MPSLPRQLTSIGMTTGKRRVFRRSALVPSEVMGRFLIVTGFPFGAGGSRSSTASLGYGRVSARAKVRLRVGDAWRYCSEGQGFLSWAELREEIGRMMGLRLVCVDFEGFR